MYCKVPNCTQEMTRPKGMCHMHYYRRIRMLKAGIPEDSATYRAKMAEPSNRNRGKYDGIECDVYGCTEQAVTKFKCKRHYQAEYMAARRAKEKMQLAEYAKIIGKTVDADVTKVPTREKEAASAHPRTLVDVIGEMLQDEVDNRVLRDMYEDGEWEGMSENEIVNYVKDWT